MEELLNMIKMNKYNCFIFFIIIIISCSYLESQTNIEVFGLEKEYKDSDTLKLIIKNNLDKRFYFHLVGDCYSKEFLWREFENNLLMQNKSKTETNFWLEPNAKYVVAIDAKKILQKFSNIPDSFRIRIVYQTVEEKKVMNFLTNNFVIKR